MTPLVQIAMLGWFFGAVPAMFILLPNRTAAFCGLVFGWLILPWSAKYSFGPLDITRESAVTYSVMLCIVVFDTSALLRLRPSWIDLPVGIWCVSPFFTSLSNDLGVYDGLSSIRSQVEVWGLPYLIGRTYVTSVEAMKHLAMVLIAGAVLYVPLIMWEIRFSPQLHKRVYGYVTYDHGGTALRRLGGYRPLVFLRHGLMLGVFMAVASLVAAWLWYNKSVEKFPLLPPGMRGKQAVPREDGIGYRLVSAIGPAVPFWMVAGGLVGVFVVCRALNGLILFAMAAGALFALRFLKSRTPLVLFAAIPFAFAGMRMSEQVTGFNFDEPIVNAVAQISEDRAGSVEFRFRNEHLLAERALERPLLGWGGWGRNRVYDEDGNDLTVTDGYWIITLGQNGSIGLFMMFSTLLLPVFVFLLRFDARQLCTPELAAGTGLAAAICMYAMDCLPNAMLNPMYVMAAGGLAGFVVVSKRKSKLTSGSRYGVQNRSQMLAQSA
ncbi:MAG: hypothetical protein ED559_02910 [Phycisphaera sp.]|nr:MAG: hypothetical protein ED559_02910 [Phycisphaera sp.]